LRPGISDLGGSGFLRLEGTTALDVNGTSAGQYDRVDVQGQLQLVGGAKFLFPNEPIASSFLSSPPLTFDNFFSLNSLPVPDLTPYQSLTYTGASPGRTFSVTLNPDRSLTFIRNVVPPTKWTDGIGNANTPSNWSLGVPSSTNPAVSTAVIDNGGTAQILAPGANTLEMRVGSATGQGNLLVDNGGLTVTLDFLVNEGSAGASSVTVQNGATVTSPSSVVGHSSAHASNFLISGAGTKFNATSNFVVGRSGAGAAALTIQNGGWLDAAASTIGSLAGSNGTATISGSGSKWTVAGGFAAGDQGAATVTIQSGGLLTSANGIIGHSAGSNGAATVTGTGSQWSISGALTAGNQGTGSLAVQNGGLVSAASSTIGNSSGSNGTATVTGTGSQWSISGALTAGSQGAATISVQNGGLLSTATSTMGNSAGSNSTATVTGAGSKWSTTSDFTVGNSGSATLSILNQGTVYVGNTLNIGSQGAVILNGGTLRLAHAGIANDLTRLNYTSGTIQLPTGTTGSGGEALFLQIFGPSGVIPANKTLAVEGGLTVINSLSPLTILNQGAVNVGGTLALITDSTVNLYGGTLRLNSYSKVPTATINFIAGTVQMAGNRTVGTDVAIQDFFGAAPVIPTAKGLTVEGTATLLTSLTLNGGTFSVGDIINSNLLNFQSGTFRMTQASLQIGSTGQFGPTLELVSGQHFVIDAAANIASDGFLQIPTGASFTAAQMNNSGEVVLNGTTARLAGGTANNSGLLRGNGRIDSTVTNLAAGEIRVDSAERLVFTSAPLVNQGQTNVVGGTLDLRQGATNSGTINLTGGAAEVYGNVNVVSGGRVSIGGSTTATLFGNITQNGVVSIAPGSKAVFFGNVSGSGSFALSGTAEFLGAVSPGSSPGKITFAGDVALNSTAVLNIELGGATPATQFDQLLVSGALSLGGILNVSLINGFNPAADDSFNILDWGTLTGTFNTTQLPTLAAGFEWNLSQLYTNGILAIASTTIPGDFNHDGAVNAADYVVWRKTDGTPAGFNAWRTHFGQTFGGGASASSSTKSAAVPEPTSLVPLLLAAAGWCLRRRRPGN
jgi:T5SS/PEP-CTERM-associated repeat protein